MVVFILFVSEVTNYLSTREVEQMKVDPTLGERLTINFDISFHALHCGGEWPPTALGARARAHGRTLDCTGPMLPY